MNNLSEYAAIIGIDWADKKHDICIQPSDTQKPEKSILEHTPESIDQWANEIKTRFNGKQVAVCIESCKIPLVYALLKYAFFVLFPVNPQTLARYRNALQPSRAKDDPTDAKLLLDIVGRHPDKFNPWQPERPEVRALGQLVEGRRSLVADRVACTNRLTAALKNYYPQALDWFDDKNTTVFCEFLERWPTPGAARRAHEATLEKFFHSHNSRRQAVIERRIASIKSLVPLTEDSGIIEPTVVMVKALVAQLKVHNEHISRFDKEIESRFSAMDDSQLFDALPGAGKQLAPRLLVAFGEDRSKFESADDLCRYAGIAPVTERSGNKTWIHWRYSCSKFLRQSFIEWSKESIRYSFWAQSFYHMQREKGKSHHMALRALAFKWIRILFRCWKDRKPYDEATYLMALKAKGSPLVKEFSN